MTAIGREGIGAQLRNAASEVPGRVANPTTIEVEQRRIPVLDKQLGRLVAAMDQARRYVLELCFLHLCRSKHVTQPVDELGSARREAVHEIS